MAEITVDLTASNEMEVSFGTQAAIDANFVGSGSESEPLIVKTIAKKVTTADEVILNTTNKSSITQNLNTYMRGYRCVGMSHVSLSNVSSSNYRVTAGEGYTVTFVCGGGQVKATGVNTSPSIPYYYTVNAKLYYLRNDLEPQEVS